MVLVCEWHICAILSETGKDKPLPSIPLEVSPERRKASRVYGYILVR